MAASKWPFITENELAEAGDLVVLNPLLEKYAPTWWAFFQEDPINYKGSALPDGNLYGLPSVIFNPYDKDLRDQWLYISPWLDELKLKVPATMEEFKNTLSAIKQAAGTGTIPADVIPYYYRFDQWIGGQLDVYGAFGVLVGDITYVTPAEDGALICQAVNPDIKEPLKFLRELYALGLTPPECFTDDQNTYLSRTGANPPIVFSYHSFNNRLPEVTMPMAPPDSGNGKTPVMRRMAYVPTGNRSIIFSKCQYAERIVQFYEWYASDFDHSITVSQGLEGVVWDKNADGKYYLHFWETSQDKMNENAESLGLWNSWFTLLSSKFYAEHFYNPNVDIVGTREWAIENIYKDHIPYMNSQYVAADLDEESTVKLEQYEADLQEYRGRTFADWITGKGDIDADWDAYVQHMKSLGLDEWLKLKQQAYDLLVK